MPKQVQRAIAGGVRVVQVRDKEMKDREFCALVSAVQRAATQEADRLGVCVRVFVNDRVMIAKELGCHVHIGQEDMPPAQVREIVGMAQLLAFLCTLVSRQFVPQRRVWQMCLG